jgi:hypothetical protein
LSYFDQDAMGAPGLAEQWFRLADEDKDGKIGGGEAVRFFTRSGLPKDVLGQVRGWVELGVGPWGSPGHPDRGWLCKGKQKILYEPRLSQAGEHQGVRRPARASPLLPLRRAALLLLLLLLLLPPHPPPSAA